MRHHQNADGLQPRTIRQAQVLLGDIGSVQCVRSSHLCGRGPRHLKVVLRPTPGSSRCQFTFLIAFEAASSSSCIAYARQGRTAAKNQQVRHRG